MVSLFPIKIDLCDRIGLGWAHHASNDGHVGSDGMTRKSVSLALATRTTGKTMHRCATSIVDTKCCGLSATAAQCRRKFFPGVNHRVGGFPVWQSTLVSH
jgi:hypothetical protein